MKIISTKQAVEHGIKLLMYGDSGVGKTTLIKTLPNPIIVSTESGLLSLSNEDIPAIEIRNESDMDSAFRYVSKSDYASICLDSISDIAEVILEEKKASFKDGRKAYGELNNVIGANIRKFRNIKGKNVYFTAKEDKMEVNEITISRPMMPGKTLTVNLPYYFDLVLRLTVSGKGDRIIHTANSFTQICKDRSGKLDKKEAPHLGDLINKIIGE